MKRNFKIKNNFYGSLLLAFEVGRLKRFFPLFVLFVYCFSAGGAIGDPEAAPVAVTGSAGDGAVPFCNSVLLGKVTNATSGMNIESYILVGQAVTNSTQVLAGDSAKSAKVAHQGKAAIDSTLSAVALKRYIKCSAAITECETICQSAITKCSNMIGKMINSSLTGPSAEAAACKKNIPEYKSTLSGCGAQQSICDQAGLQAGLSGLSALTSLFAAKQLSDCEGDECGGTKVPIDKTPPPPPKPPPIPPVLDASRPDQYTGTAYPFDSNDPNFGSPALLPSAPDKPKPQPGKKPESQPKNNPSDDSPSGLVAGSSSSGNGSTSSPSGSQGGVAASRGFDKKLNMFEEGDKENGDFEDLKGKYLFSGDDRFFYWRGRLWPFTSRSKFKLWSLQTIRKNKNSSS